MTSQELETSWVQTVIIRHLTQTDLPALEWDGEFIHFRRLYLDAFQRAQRGLSICWVAELNPAGIIGQAFVQLNCDRNELADGCERAYLYSFRIRPAYRDAGLGSRMLQIIEDDLIDRGFNRVTLNVAQDNPDARRLYERKGYSITGFEPGTWSYLDHVGRKRNVFEPAWRMEKILR